jgi:glycosyltransferase involved in cell wall biosynthesis
MNILFVLENYLPHVGGVETVFRNLTEGLAKKGHIVSIITHKIKGTKKTEKINGVKIYRIGCFGSRYLFTFLSIPKVIKLARKADIIHTTTFNGAPAAYVGAKVCNKPIILTVHEVWLNRWREFTELSWLSCKIHNFLEKLVYSLSYTKYVGVSKATKDQLIENRISKEKVSAIYNGVDYDHWNQKKYDGKKIRKLLGLENTYIYMMTGRPGVSKGHEYLIRAVPLIAQKIKRSKLILIMSKESQYVKRYEYLMSIIKKIKFANNILVINPVSYKELPNYIKAADCIVVPSLTEGFGYNVAEAAAMGKPIVASNVFSIPEIISGKFVLVPPKNPEALANAIYKVYKGHITKKSLKRFSIENNIQGYLKVYKEVLK